MLLWSMGVQLSWLAFENVLHCVLETNFVFVEENCKISILLLVLSSWMKADSHGKRIIWVIFDGLKELED